MGAIVVDTHTAIWYLLASSKISPVAVAALDEAVMAGDPVYVASISVVEVVYLVEKGKLPEAAFERLIRALDDAHSSFAVVPLDLDIIRAIRKIPKEVVPDLPDRIITATALHLDLPLVTRNLRIHSTPVKTIW